MKLDPTQLRYMAKEDFRLLQAVETGSRNHEIVPISLISRLTGLRPQNVTKQLQVLAKNKLVSFESDSKYEGVRLTYGGYDFLALKAFSTRETVVSIGQQIGVGKESDIYLVFGRSHYDKLVGSGAESESESDSQHEAEEDIEDPVAAVDPVGAESSDLVVSAESLQERVLKIQRLGRTSFRTVKTNRDYHQHRSNCSWLYLSRLAAGLEYRFMRALWEVGLPVPKPLDWNRHCVVMEYIRGSLLDNVRLERHEGQESCESESEADETQHEDRSGDCEEPIQNRSIDYIKEDQVPGLYAHLMHLIGELAAFGLIHGDFNEFNLLLTTTSSAIHPIIIDFPQMVSISHPDAQFYFERDVECIRIFFAKRFGFRNSDGALKEPQWQEFGGDRLKRKLDVELRASGYIKPKRR